ncbi:hypothetical protein EG329_012307 [Mollisiaceae sp. DMI_Dod_QoI]|nr:hypothetical protein EG329_012307 [Helotiales sp. DMI_Dod_QoI]
MESFFFDFAVPTQAAVDLDLAKDAGEGITFNHRYLKELVDFSQTLQLMPIERGRDEDAKIDFNELLERAAEAVMAKVNFALTAGEVVVWHQFFHRVATWKTLQSDSAIEMKMGVQKIQEKLAACEKAGQDMWLDFSEVKDLHNFYIFLKASNRALLNKCKDPTHPQITAMEKVSRVATSRNAAQVYLDSEEVCCIFKLLKSCPEITPLPLPNGEDTRKQQIKPNVSDGILQGVEALRATPALRNDQAKEEQRKPLGRKDENKGMQASSTTTAICADSSQSKKDQSKTADSKASNTVIAFDDKLKTLVTKYLPEIVPSVLESKELPIHRWMNHIEVALGKLDEKARKTQLELEQLSGMMLDDEQEYEERLQDARDDYAELEEETKHKMAKLELELQTANNQLSKKASNYEKKYEEQLQVERDLYAKLKKETEEKLVKVDSELQTANNKIEKAKTEVTKREAKWATKLQTSNNDAIAWKDMFDAEVAGHDVLKLDYEATLQELASLKVEYKKIAERETKCAALENELAVLRSSRTNPQVEKDNIAKAVRNATADKQAKLDKAQAGVAKLRTELQEKQAELAKQSQQCKEIVKEKDSQISLLKDSLAAMEEILSKTKIDLEEARHQSSPDPTTTQMLDEERIESKHLKNTLNSAADILQALALQLRT